VKHEVFMMDIDPGSSLPSGAYLRLTSMGTLGGVPDQEVGTLHIEKVGSDIEYTADFTSVGSTTQTIEVYNQGTLVFTTSGHSGPALSMPDWLKCFLRGCPPDDWRPTFGSSTAITIPGSGTAIGDEVRIIAENVTTPPDRLSSTILQAKDISEVTLTNETTSGFIRYFKGLAHATVGDAALSIDEAGNLAVSNIGSSGQDGVETRLPPPDGSGSPVEHEVFMMDIDPLNSLPSGAFLHITSTGTLSGLPGQEVGTLHIEKVGSNIEYTADFTSVGSTTQTIEVYDQGALVFSTSGHTGTAISMPDWLKCFLRGCPPDDWRPTFGSSTAMTIPGSGMVVGDEVRIIAENVTTPPDSLSKTILVMKDLTGITYTDETTSGFSTDPGTPFCSPGEGGVTACPCPPGSDAPHAPGHGCSNSINTNGALMGGSGIPSVASDTLVLQVKEMTNGLGLCFEGTSFGSGLPVGDGIRCITGALKRFGSKVATNRTWRYPEGGETPIHVRTRAVAGNTRHYQLFYRNAGTWCNAATFNVSSAYSILWQP
jgi:hypothetical protein